MSKDIKVINIEVIEPIEVKKNEKLVDKVLTYFKGDELSTSAWIEKYKLGDESSPDDMHKRLAVEFAKIEKQYIELERVPEGVELSEYGRVRPDLDEKGIYELFKDFKYIIPQGSIMSQLGNNISFGSISNCVVIDSPEDSYAGIMEVDSQLAHLMKRRCGVGVDISTLRPATSEVSNAAKSSTGAVSFMNRFSSTTKEVAQGGRRGALMLTMDIRHPDIQEFIICKRDLSKITGANISIKVNDGFLKAVENDEDYILSYPCDQQLLCKYEEEPYDELIRDEDFYIKKIRAKELYELFIESNWMSAEPAFLFWDRVLEYSPDSVYNDYKQKSTNPCSEIAMQPFDTCRLMVLNLTSFVYKPYTQEAVFDYATFYTIAYEQQRLADDLIDLEVLKIDRILNKLNKENNPKNKLEIALWSKLKQTALDGRRTGCGFTGLGDTFAMLGMDYDSEEALLFVDRTMSTKMEAELDCTIDLSITRGSFEGWDKDKEFPRVEAPYDHKGSNPFYTFLIDNFFRQSMRMIKYGRRNVSWSTVAPTGTVSIMSQTTSGIEPLFMSYYTRRKKINSNESSRVDFVDDNGDSWTEFKVLHRGIKDWWESIHSSIAPVPDITELDKEHFIDIIKSSPYYKSTADKIDWLKRVELQSIVQKYTTHAISSTINLPSDVTHKEIGDIYNHAWKNGLKGITVYRDGCRSGVLVANPEKKEDVFEDMDSLKRPKVLDMDLFHVTAKGERFTLIIGLMNSRPYEVFAVRDELGEHNVTGTIVKLTRGRYDITQGDITYEDITSEMTGAEISLTRLISMGLRHRVNVKYIVEQLNKSEDFIVSFSKAIARTLKRYIPEGEKSTSSCNNCKGSNVIFEEGCCKCLDCGLSACS